MSNSPLGRLFRTKSVDRLEAEASTGPKRALGAIDLVALVGAVVCVQEIHSVVLFVGECLEVSNAISVTIA